MRTFFFIILQNFLSYFLYPNKIGKDKTIILKLEV